MVVGGQSSLTPTKRGGGGRGKRFSHIEGGTKKVLR